MKIWPPIKARDFRDKRGESNLRKSVALPPGIHSVSESYNNSTPSTQQWVDIEVVSNYCKFALFSLQKYQDLVRHIPSSHA